MHSLASHEGKVWIEKKNVLARADKGDWKRNLQSLFSTRLKPFSRRSTNHPSSRRSGSPVGTIRPNSLQDP